MTFLPVVERELRVASRLRGTHWVRLMAALIALAIGGWIMIVPSFRRTPGDLGAALFVSMSTLINLYALLIGLLRTVDCLSEEKREGTLGLLFLTDLKGYDIVFGKLAATSLNAFYGMLAIFPVLAISLLVGGVSGGEFWRMVLVSINNLFFSLAVGIFCSALSRDERKALTLGLLLISFLTVGLPLLGEIFRAWENTKELNPVFFILSPGYDFVMAFDSNYNGTTGLQIFYPSVGAVHGMAWLFLALSCVIVPRTWQDRPLSSSSVRRRLGWEIWVYGSTFKRARLRLRLLAENPFYWLTSRDLLKSRFVWGFLGGVGLFWVWGLSFYPSDWKNASAYCWTGFITHIVLKFWIAGEACHRFCLDRQSGALELLLSSPLSVRDILQGQLMSLRRQFAGPVVMVLFSDLIFLASENEADWTFYWVAWTTMLIADLITLSWVGMWMGLTSRNSARAAAASIVRVLLLPWIAFLALLTMMTVSTLFFSRFMPRGFDGKLMICLWMIFGFVNNVIFGLWASRKLQTEFRMIATRRFETRTAAKVTPPATPMAQPLLVQG